MVMFNPEIVKKSGPYLSLGDKEKLAKNPRLAAVEDCTRQAAELLRAHNIPVAFEMNRGGHFQDIPARITRGVSSLITP